MQAWPKGQFLNATLRARHGLVLGSVSYVGLEPAWRWLLISGPIVAPALEGPIATAAKLLARKQQLLERLQENPGLHEREEIELRLAGINAALTLLDDIAPGEAWRRAS